MSRHLPFPAGRAQGVDRRTVLLTCTLAGFVIAGCSKENTNPTSSKAPPSRSPLPADGNPTPTEDDRCPMCAMRVLDHPEWVGAIQLADGSTYYTCSVRCTLATSMNSDKFLGVAKEQVTRVRVPHYLAKGKSLDAEKAWYVIDSDVRGPMGLALLTAASEDEAKTLVERHRGRVIARKDVTMDVLKDLKQRSKSQ